MHKVFADTGYWIALLDPADTLHQKAVAVSRRVQTDRILTSEMVLAEFLNCFSGMGPFLRGVAAKAAQSLRGSQGVTIVPQTPSLFSRALRRYQDMTDKAWSLTDCASFLIMEDEHLTAALTHDQHFSQAGFDALLR